MILEVVHLTRHDGKRILRLGSTQSLLAPILHRYHWHWQTHRSLANNNSDPNVLLSVYYSSSVFLTLIAKLRTGSLSDGPERRASVRSVFDTLKFRPTSALAGDKKPTVGINQPTERTLDAPISPHTVKQGKPAG